MKKLFAILLCASHLFLAFAEVSFTPYIDVLTDISFSKDVPYIVGPRVKSTIGFNLQIFPQAYFSSEIVFSLLKPIEFFNITNGSSEGANVKFFSSILTFPNILEKNVYLSLFYGNYDKLNSDRILREITKTKIEESFLRTTFPMSIFTPKLSIDGVGFSVYGNLTHIPFYLAGYVYWNGKVTKETYRISTDFRFGYNFGFGSLNSFCGVDFAHNIKETTFKLGLSGLFLSPDTYSFYFDLGLSNFNIGKIKTDYKNIKESVYAIFEPRIKTSVFGLSIPFFASPITQLEGFDFPTSKNDKIEERFLLGIGCNILGASLEYYGFEAGLSVLTAVDLEGIGFDKEYNVMLSPFFKYEFLNYCLDARINFFPCLRNTPEKVVTFSIQIKAVR